MLPGRGTLRGAAATGRAQRSSVDGRSKRAKEKKGSEGVEPRQTNGRIAAGGAAAGADSAAILPRPLPAGTCWPRSATRLPRFCHTPPRAHRATWPKTGFVRPACAWDAPCAPCANDFRSIGSCSMRCALCREIAHRPAQSAYVGGALTVILFLKRRQRSGTNNVLGPYTSICMCTVSMDAVDAMAPVRHS